MVDCLCLSRDKGRHPARQESAGSNFEMTLGLHSKKTLTPDGVSVQSRDSDQTLIGAASMGSDLRVGQRLDHVGHLDSKTT
jgi:hypothetical protein